MKVLILTEGGKNIGFGHLSRCIALAQGFREKKINTEVIVRGDSSIDFLLKRIKHRKINWLKERKKIFKELKCADVAIIDSYLANLEFYKKVSRIVKLPVYIDDYKRLDYPRGIVINPSIYGDKIKYLRKKDVDYLAGKDYIILRKEFWNVPAKYIRRKIKNVLITLGGGEEGNRNLPEKLLKFLIRHFPHFNYYVISSTHFSIPPSPYPSITCFPVVSAEKMKELMLKCDFAISGGGQTTYELARVGVPTIGICFAENQIFNLKYGEKAGYLKSVGEVNEGNLFNKIIEEIKDLNYSRRLKMNERGRNHIEDNGVVRILQKIKKR